MHLKEKTQASPLHLSYSQANDVEEKLGMPSCKEEAVQKRSSR